MKGKIIVFEGLDGSGKCTQSKLLFEYLKKRRENVHWESIPNYNSSSSSPIKMYLNKEITNNLYDINEYSTSSFFAVDRVINYFQTWKKIYENGSIIICDRYSTSNMIYQLAKTKKSKWDEFLEWVEDYEYNKLTLPSPDMVIYLKVPIKISQDLIKKRSSPDLYESNKDFLKKCSEAADYSSKKFNWNVINCSQNGEKIDSIEEISEKIVNIVEKTLQKTIEKYKI